MGVNSQTADAEGEGSKCRIVRRRILSAGLKKIRLVKSVLRLVKRNCYLAGLVGWFSFARKGEVRHDHQSENR